MNNSYWGITKMAIPLMLGSFIQSVVLFTDAAFVSRLGTIPFDGAGNAGLIYFTLFMLSIGWMDGSQILIARKMGEIQLRKMGSIVHHSAIGQAFIALTLFVGLTLINQYGIHQITKSEAIGNQIQLYLGIRKWGVFLACAQGVMMSYLMGTARTQPVIFATIFMGTTNIILDYLLIFGYGGFPAMNIEGAALASVIAEGVGCLTLLFFILQSKSRFKKFLFQPLLLKWKWVKEIFTLSFPLMIQGLIAMGAWTVFFSMIEQLGPTPLEVSQVIRSIYFIAFVPIFGFSAATKTYVSYYKGRNDISSIIQVQKKVILLNLVFLFLIFHGALFYPEVFIKVVDNNPEIFEATATILRWIFGSVLLFGVSSVLFNTINGLGHTKYTLFVEIISLTLYQTAAYIVIFVALQPVENIWMVEYIYFGCLGLFSWLFLKYSKYKIY